MQKYYTSSLFNMVPSTYTIVSTKLFGGNHTEHKKAHFVTNTLGSRDCEVAKLDLENERFSFPISKGFSYDPPQQISQPWNVALAWPSFHREIKISLILHENAAENQEGSSANHIRSRHQVKAGCKSMLISLKFSLWQLHGYRMLLYILP